MKGSETKLLKKQATASMVPATTAIQRWPTRSISLPIKINKIPDASVAEEYIVEIIERLHPNSST